MSAPTFEQGALVLDGRFRIERLLGRGGMGDVFLAEQVSLKRKVALKVLRAELSSQAGMAERFEREAHLLSSVDHPGVVRVIDFGQSHGAHFLVMDLLDGRSLELVLRQETLTVPRALSLLRQMAEGLAAIHEKGIVHRDLKPENVLVTSTSFGERARLLDFGIAKLAGPTTPGAPGSTQVGVVIGTPEYLSPEQALGSGLDARSDVYAFGVVAYRMLSGKLPFEGPTPQKFLAQHASAAPAPLLGVAPHVPPALAAWVMSCLSKEPAARPSDGRGLLSALGGLPVDAESAPPLAPPSPPAGSGTAQFGVVAAPGTSAPAGGGTAQFGVVAAAPAVAASVPAPPPELARVPTGEFVRPAPRPTGSNEALSRPQNLTLMLTDIKGFTERTGRQTHEQNAAMLQQHDALLLPVVKKFEGKVVQKRGDALLVTFRSPTEAVRCGMAMQDRLWRYNIKVAPGDALPVRICLHVGDVAVTKDGPIGEPVQVVGRIEGVAEAGQVTFSESVRLSMNRADVPHEECGQLDEMKLYRVVGAVEGLPFGGLDEDVPLFSPTEQLQQLAKATAAVGKKTWKPVLAAGVAALLVFGVATFLLMRPLVRARRHLSDERPGEALLLLQSLEKSERESDDGRFAEAEALHGLKRHKEEWAVLSGLHPKTLAELDEETLRRLAEDIGRGEREGALKTLLGKISRERVTDVFSDLAEDDLSEAQWGALRYLEANGLTASIDVGEEYARALSSKECRIRGVAAKRLGELGDQAAVPALEKLKAEPRKGGGLFSEGNCGQDEAGAALQKLKR